MRNKENRLRLTYANQAYIPSKSQAPSNPIFSCLYYCGKKDHLKGSMVQKKSREAGANIEGEKTGFQTENTV